jgi:hypothetical protein
MKTNIDVSLINIKKCKKIINETKSTENVENTTEKKIKLYDFFSINENKICNKIRKIPNYFDYYNIITQNSFISIGEMHEKTVDNFNIVNANNNEKYVLFEYDYKININFEDFLYNLPNPKLFIFHTLDTYSCLLNSLNLLQKNGVCFFNLSPKNIIFDTNFKPILNNFEKSLLITNIANQTYFINIIKKINDFTYKPIELHLLFYVIMNNEERLSSSLLDIICDNYIKNMHILSFLSDNYKISYKNECINFLKKYVNKSQKEIIDNVSANHTGWDNYELSVLYLHIFGNIINIFSLKETFINKIFLCLIKNIHPNPLKRETIENTLNSYNKLFNENTDWSFVNSILQNKMKLLYDAL